MLSAIIVAGGSSRRMGFDKTFAVISGKPVIVHSIAAFEATESVTEIIIVGREERLNDLQEAVAAEVFQKIRAIVAGGIHRQDSVSKGLDVLSAAAKYVAVHDAARPLVRPEQIERTFEQTRLHGAAALAAPVRDTLKRADQDHAVCGSISRENVYAMETPQIFERALLAQAYARVAEKRLSITDEVSALEELGRKVVVVPNENWNFKLTYPDDLPLAEFILAGRKA